MGLDAIVLILVATVAASVPLILAALGELVVEKSGVLNLGVEGMMAVGAIVAFAVAVETQQLSLAALAGALAGALMSLIFAFITLTLMANQVATGLALTLFGTGLSAFLGLKYTSVALDGAKAMTIPILSDIPVLGKLLFSYNGFVYFAVLVFLAISWFLYRSRAGLVLRAIGESPSSAHALGASVIKVRYLAVLFGGAMAGLAGAYLSTAYTPLWAEGMIAGRGWIALALVVFATWRPARVLIGALLFGGVTIAQFHVQGIGIEIPAQFLSMLPYLATILVLVVISRDAGLIRLNAPASLGQPFHKQGH
ncbi:ABC transporter permease [Thiolinea disciformis]|uniref:ABC transporter permease n=1 Tax=Thiolinea disciformis TaxID=125614 RepID=UPI00036CF505|nr:ABC transporter permease [Thiolinea disciformis]